MGCAQRVVPPAGRWPWQAFVLAFGLVSGAAQAAVSSPAAADGVLLVVLDGFGIGGEAEGNAVAQFLRLRPDGFLARALVKKSWPQTLLCASGACVGLPEGTDGNSEAGHNNLCAAETVEQLSTQMQRLRGSGSLQDEPGFAALFASVRERKAPLHLVAALADRSSAGSYLDAVAVSRAAMAAGVERVWVHGICSGRSGQSCLAMAQAIEAVGANVQMASVAGTESCYSRVGGGDGVNRCVAAFLEPRSAQAPTLARLLEPLSGKAQAQSQLVPTALVGSAALTAKDTVLLLQYRRDLSYGMLRRLRGDDELTGAVAAGGPDVWTLQALDASSTYLNDRHRHRVFTEAKAGGFLHRRLQEAGIRQLRVAESDKAAHVTYFCDASDVDDSALYGRFHPKAFTEALTRAPCLRSPEAAARVRMAMQAREARFLLLNLPNADLLGHTGDQAATVAGLACLDDELNKLWQVAQAERYWLVVTADHGNAEAMGRTGGQAMSHTTSPVPLILVPPPGRQVRLKDAGTPLPLSAVSWTVLDLLGLPNSREHSVCAW